MVAAMAVAFGILCLWRNTAQHALLSERASLLRRSHEHVRVHQHVRGPGDIGRRGQGDADRLSLEVFPDGQGQPVHQDLMPEAWGGRHQELAVHDFVPVAVVRHRADHVGGVVDGCGHAHTFVSAAGSWQGGTIRQGATPARRPRHRFPAAVIASPALTK